MASGNGYGSTVPASSSSGGPVSSSSKLNTILIVHGTLAGLAFLLFLPLGALAWHLIPSTPGLVWVHAGVQMFAYSLVLVVLGTGVWQAKTLKLFTAFNGHPIIGLIIIGLLTLQPVLGLNHHARYSKGGGNRTSSWARTHVWLGRLLLILGAVNGGLGLMLAGNTDKGKIAWSVIAGVAGVVYFTVVTVATMRKSGKDRGRKAINGQ